MALRSALCILQHMLSKQTNFWLKLQHGPLNTSLIHTSDILDPPTGTFACVANSVGTMQTNCPTLCVCRQGDNTTATVCKNLLYSCVQMSMRVVR